MTGRTANRVIDRSDVGDAAVRSMGPYHPLAVRGVCSRSSNDSPRLVNLAPVDPSDSGAPAAVSNTHSQPEGSDAESGIPLIGIGPCSHPLFPVCDPWMVPTDSTNPPLARLTASALQFVTDRHLAILSTLSSGGAPIHSVPVGFTVESGTLRIITSDGTQKVRNVERGGHATVAQVDGATWISFAGPTNINRNPDAVAHAVALYSARYRPPRANPTRVVIEMTIAKILGSSGMV